MNSGRGRSVVAGLIALALLSAFGCGNLGGLVDEATSLIDSLTGLANGTNVDAFQPGGNRPPPGMHTGPAPDPNFGIVVDPNSFDPNALFDPDSVVVTHQPPPPPPQPQGPLFPNLLPACDQPTVDCRLLWEDALGGKLLIFDTSDGAGGALRNYLFLCATLEYCLIQTVFDGVSPPSSPVINNFFTTSQGERVVFATDDYYDGDLWSSFFLNNGDLVITFPISLVEFQAHAGAIGQPLYFVINRDAQNNIYVNGSPASIFLAGGTCFGG